MWIFFLFLFSFVIFNNHYGGGVGVTLTIISKLGFFCLFFKSVSLLGDEHLMEAIGGKINNLVFRDNNQYLQSFPLKDDI